jgi:glutaredoxin
MRKWLQFFVFSWIIISTLHAETPVWQKNPETGQITINVELYMASTCPHCHKALQFLEKLQKTAPIQIKKYIINEDKVALTSFAQRIKHDQVSNFAVPSIYFCNTRWIGFSTEQVSGKLLSKGLDYCYQQIQAQGQLTPRTAQVLQDWSTASQVHVEQSIQARPLQFMLSTAFFEALTPCSLFLFITLLAFLWVIPQTKNWKLGGGILFILSLMVIHYLQQVYVAQFVQSYLWGKPPALIVGFILVIFFSAYLIHQTDGYISLRQRKTLPLLIIITVPCVLIFQQTCGYNLSIVFAEWLARQNFSGNKKLWMNVSYQFIYILPFLLILILDLYFYSNTYRRKFKFHAYAGALILWLMGLVLAIWPTSTSSLFISLVVLVVSLCIGKLIAKQYERENS